MPGKVSLASTFSKVRQRHRGDYSYTNAEETSEPVLVDLLRSPGTDSHPGVPVQQPYLSYHRPARLHRLAGSIPPNRFLSPYL
jgi:hypothetical protein